MKNPLLSHPQHLWNVMGNAPDSLCASSQPHRAEENAPLPSKYPDCVLSLSHCVTHLLQPPCAPLSAESWDLLQLVCWAGEGRGAAKIPKEASLDNVSFLHFLTAAPWGMTNGGKMLLMSQDKNYDYLLGCHPPRGILARDISPLFLLVPRARWDPECSMVKGLSCLLTPCFQTVPLARAARDVSCLGLLCPFRHVCLELLTVT